MLFLLGADKSFGQEASDISFEKVKETCKGISREDRLRITVTRFSVSSRAAQATGQFGEELTAIMTNAIQQTDCFRVLESTKNKSDLDDELSYNETGRTDGSGPQWGQQLGAQAIVTAEITEYNDGTSRIRVGPVSTVSSNVKIGLIVKVIDPETREVLWSKSVNGEIKKPGISRATSLGGLVKFGDDSKVSKAMSAVVEDIVLRTVDILVKEKEVILKEFAAKEAAPKLARTTIVVNNTDFLNFSRLSTELKDHGNVEEIREKTISGANGSFVVLHHGSTDDLAQIIFDKSGAKYEIVSMRPGVIALMAEDSPGTSHAQYKNILHEKAGSYRNMGDYARALTTYQALIDAAKSRSGEQYPEYSRSLSNLAGLYMEIGAFDQSLSLYQEVVSSAESSLDINTPEYATTLNNLAVLYSEIGDDAKALSELEKAVIISRKNNNYQSHIGILTNMAQLHLKMGNCTQALALYSEMATWTKEALGREHPDFARSLATVAAMYEDMGRYAESLLIHREVLEITGKTLGPHAPYFEQRKNAMRVNYRLLKQLQNKFEQFKPLCEALEKNQEYKNILKEDFAGIFGRTTCHEKPGPTVNDLTLLLSALASETGDSIKISAVLSLAETYKAVGGYGKADSLYAYILEHVNRHGDKYIEIHLNMGEMRRQQGVFEQAALHYDTVLAVLNKRIVPSDALYLRTYSEYAALQRAQNNLAKADSLYTKAQEFGQRVKYLPEYPVLLTEAAALKMRMGQPEEALTLLESCMALTKRQEREPSLGRKNYALFFCADQYEDTIEWPPLKNPISDGEALAAVLHDKFDFDTLVFRNPKVSTIIDEIEKTLKREYRSNDQLFLFFAGHGYFNNDSKMGGIVACNTKKNDSATRLGYEMLRARLADNHPCRHIFLAIDVCFGGTFFKEVAQEKSSGRGYGSVGGNYRGARLIQNDIIVEMIDPQRAALRSRYALTSGGKDLVPDGEQYSPFAQQLLALFNNIDKTVLTEKDLFSATQGLSPRPILDTFDGHESGGEFFFFKND